MATSLDKLENKVQIHDLHVKRFHMVKRLRKSVQYILIVNELFSDGTLRCYATNFVAKLAITPLSFGILAFQNGSEYRNVD